MSAMLFPESFSKKEIEKLLACGPEPHINLRLKPVENESCLPAIESASLQLKVYVKTPINPDGIIEPVELQASRIITNADGSVMLRFNIEDSDGDGRALQVIRGATNPSDIVADASLHLNLTDNGRIWELKYIFTSDNYLIHAPSWKLCMD